jgi:hypothetical protein
MKQKNIKSKLERERERERTASGLPMILATVEVASERMEEVSTPSRLTLVEMFRHGIFSLFLCFFTLFLWSLLPQSAQTSLPKIMKWRELGET